MKWQSILHDNYFKVHDLLRFRKINLQVCFHGVDLISRSYKEIGMLSLHIQFMYIVQYDILTKKLISRNFCGKVQLLFKSVVLFAQLPWNHCNEFAKNCSFLEKIREYHSILVKQIERYLEGGNCQRIQIIYQFQLIVLCAMTQIRIFRLLWSI